MVPVPVAAGRSRAPIEETLEADIDMNRNNRTTAGLPSRRHFRCGLVSTQRELGCAATSLPYTVY
jgi:hypothetical protein